MTMTPREKASPQMRGPLKSSLAQIIFLYLYNLLFGAAMVGKMACISTYETSLIS